MAGLQDLVDGFKAWGFTDAQLGYLAAQTDPAVWKNAVNIYYQQLHPGAALPFNSDGSQNPSGPIAPAGGVNFGTPPAATTQAAASTPAVQPAPASSPSTQNQDAVAYLNDLLSQYGLNNMGDWAWNEITNNNIDINSTAGRARALQDLRKTTQWAQAFPGLVARQQAGLAPMNEGEYVTYTKAVSQDLDNLLPGVYTPAEKQALIGQLVGGDVSQNEAETRIQNVLTQAMTAPTEVRQMFSQWFGVGAGEKALAAYMLDPTHASAKLEKQLTAASIGGEGQDLGVGVNQDTAMQLAARGETAQSTLGGLQKVQMEDPLFHENMAEGQDLTQQTGLNAQFGLDSTSQQALQRRLEERKAGFASASGQMQVTQKGVGVGPAGG